MLSYVTMLVCGCHQDLKTSYPSVELLTMLMLVCLFTRSRRTSYPNVELRPHDLMLAKFGCWFLSPIRR